MDLNRNKLLTNHTRNLSAYIEETTYYDFPKEVVERAKTIIIHTLGSALAASNLEESKKISVLAKKTHSGSLAEATAWNSAGRMSLEGAVLINGVLAELLNWGDCSPTGNPASGTVPVSFAVAEAYKRSGKELITAVILGYEISQRIALAVKPSDEEIQKRGWGDKSWQLYAAITPALKLMGLDKLHINNGLSMATTCSILPSSLCCYTLSDFRSIEHGLRNQTAVTLARNAVWGSENLEDAFDYKGAFAAHYTENPCCEWYTKGLGEQFLILDTQLKPWPADIQLQPYIQLCSDLLKKHGIGESDIKWMDISPGIASRMNVPKDKYETVAQASGNIPFALSALCFFPEQGWRWYLERTREDSKVLSLARSIKSNDTQSDTIKTYFEMLGEESTEPKTVSICTTDNKIFRDTMEICIGHPQHMFSAEQVSKDFCTKAEQVMTTESAQKLLKALWDLESFNDVSKIMELLQS